MTLNFECESFDDAVAKAHAAHTLGMGFVIESQWDPDPGNKTMWFVVTVYPEGETPAGIPKGGE